MKNLTPTSINKITNFFNRINLLSTNKKFNNSKEQDLTFKQSKGDLLFFVSFGSWTSTTYDLEIAANKYKSSNLHSEKAEDSINKGIDVIVSCTRKKYNEALDKLLLNIDNRIDEL